MVMALTGKYDQHKVCHEKKGKITKDCELLFSCIHVSGFLSSRGYIIFMVLDLTSHLLQVSLTEQRLVRTQKWKTV